MKLQYAKKLHKGDEVIVKKTGDVQMVVETACHLEETPKHVDIYLEDGNWYSHKEVK